MDPLRCTRHSSEGSAYCCSCCTYTYRCVICAIVLSQFLGSITRAHCVDLGQMQLMCVCVSNNVYRVLSHCDQLQSLCSSTCPRLLLLPVPLLSLPCPSPPPSTKDQTGTQLISGEVTNGRLSCTVRRAITTGDTAQDYPLNQSSYILFAFGDAQGV